MNQPVGPHPSGIGPSGGGLATSVLSDRDGEVGRGAQALVVRAR